MPRYLILRSCLIFLAIQAGGFLLWGQIDSTEKPLFPTKDGRPAETYGIQTFDSPDSTYLPPWLEEKRDSANQSIPERLKSRWESYQAVYGPRLYENEEEKMRFYIRFPKRDSVDLPFPIGLLPVPPRPPYNPNIAWQRSALLPGWGQAYNRSYWKIPIFLIGYGGTIWWLSYNQGEYRRYGSAYFCAAVQQPNGQDCTIPEDISLIGDTEGIRTRRNQFRGNRDNAILIVLAWHGLQILEAFVDAHLKNFDVSPDLSSEWKLRPMPISTYGVATAGLGVGLTF